jgi:hypothetical protein
MFEWLLSHSIYPQEGPIERTSLFADPKAQSEFVVGQQGLILDLALNTAAFAFRRKVQSGNAFAFPLLMAEPLR